MLMDCAVLPPSPYAAITTYRTMVGEGATVCVPEPLARLGLCKNPVPWSAKAPRFQHTTITEVSHSIGRGTGEGSTVTGALGRGAT